MTVSAYDVVEWLHDHGWTSIVRSGDQEYFEKDGHHAMFIWPESGEVDEHALEKLKEDFDLSSKEYKSLVDALS